MCCIDQSSQTSVVPSLRPGEPQARLQASRVLLCHQDCHSLRYKKQNYVVDIKWMIKKYYEQLNAHQFDNVGKMGQFFERYNLK